MISKLRASKGRIDKNEKLNISFDDWKQKVEVNPNIHFVEEIFDWAKNSKQNLEAVILSKSNPESGARLYHDNFWYVVRVSFPNKLEPALMPIIADFADSLNAQLLTSDTKEYPRNKVVEFRRLYPDLAQPARRQYSETQLGINTAWLAIRGIEPQTAFDLLHLQLVGQAKWKESVDASDGEKVLIAPTLNAWTVLQGFELPSIVHIKFGHLDDDEHPDNSIIHFLEQLSQVGGEAHLYMDNEQSSFYAAYGAKAGKLLFRYMDSEMYRVKEGPVPTTTTDEVDIREVNRSHGIDLDEFLYMKALPSWDIPLYERI